LRGPRTIGVESASDLAKTAAIRMLGLDARYEFGRNGSFATEAPQRLTRGARLLGSLGEVALELRDRDQASTPLGRDRRDHRNHASVERGEVTLR
jgi:hypothetical protein